MKSSSVNSNAVENLTLKSKDFKKSAEKNGKADTLKKIGNASTNKGENKIVKLVETENEESENSLNGVHVNVSSMQQFVH